MIENLNDKQIIALGEIIGTIPSDAYFGLSQSGYYNYILCAKDRDFVEYTISNFNELGITTKLHRRKCGLWYTEVSRKYFTDLLKYFRRIRGNWIFSTDVIRSANENFISAIIRSFADADGTVACCERNKKHYSRRIAMYNKTEELLKQLQLLLKNYSVNSTIKLDRVARVEKVKGEIVNFPDTYSLRITNYRNLKIYKDKINFGIIRKRKRLEEILNSYSHIGREYSADEYYIALSMYKKLNNCREVARQIGIPPQTVQNWVLLGRKPRILMY